MADEVQNPKGRGGRFSRRWAEDGEGWRDFGPDLGAGAGIGQAAAGALPEATSATPGGKKPKAVGERRREMVDGVEYVRDGSVMFPVEAVMAAGGDFNAVDPKLAISYQGTVNKRQGRGRGFRGDGAWAQAAGAAGLGDAVGAGWTQNSPMFGMVQDLVYGQKQMGVNGTIVEQRDGMWNIYDRQGNLVQSGQGTLPPGSIDTAAQSQFETQARDAILRKGGSLAARLQGGGTAPTDPAQVGSTNKPGVPPQTKDVNGVRYQLQPDGTWVKVGPTPAPGPAEMDPAQGGGAAPGWQPAPTPPQPAPPTTRPPQMVGAQKQTLAPPPTGPTAPPVPAMKNPLQASVSSYLGAPKLDGSGVGGPSSGVGAFKQPKLGGMGMGMPKPPKLGF